MHSLYTKILSMELFQPRFTPAILPSELACFVRDTWHSGLVRFPKLGEINKIHLTDLTQH